MTPKLVLFPNFWVFWWQNFPNFSSYFVNLARPYPKFCLQTWCEVQAPLTSLFGTTSPPGSKFWLNTCTRRKINKTWNVKLHRLDQVRTFWARLKLLALVPTWHMHMAHSYSTGHWQHNMLKTLTNSYHQFSWKRIPNFEFMVKKWRILFASTNCFRSNHCNRSHAFLSKQFERTCNVVGKRRFQAFYWSLEQ